MSEQLEELKNEATSLGIKFSAAIGEAKLKEKIEAFYVSQETSGPALEQAVKDAEKQDDAPKVKAVSGFNKKRFEREKAARKTRVITIVDNDQRVNNHTTTCVVNCSNEFFDLGTRVLPLGEKIEVAQGHINVLKEVVIPLHSRNTKTGLAVMKSRARYSISYEDV